LQTFGSFEERREPAAGGPVTRAPFLFFALLQSVDQWWLFLDHGPAACFRSKDLGGNLVRFLWASKENEQKIEFFAGTT
jgi:hypothetical protein